MRINFRDKYYHFNCEKGPISKIAGWYETKLMLGKDSHSRLGDTYFLGKVLVGDWLVFINRSQLFKNNLQACKSA